MTHTGDLKKKLSVPALMQELPRLGLLHRQAAEDERTGSEPEILVRFLSFQTNTGDRLGTAKPLFRYEEFNWGLREGSIRPI